ncbi:hypothetical protein NMY22_g14801 [Coprinellus aureogranulatus]|nr:hypothetical protein NMY22_g14801 [Coprinellus aureogranulatus]
MRTTHRQQRPHRIKAYTEVARRVPEELRERKERGDLCAWIALATVRLRVENRSTSPVPPAAGALALELALDPGAPEEDEEEEEEGTGAGYARVRLGLNNMQQSHVTDVVDINLVFEHDAERFPVHLDGEDGCGEEEFADHGLAFGVYDLQLSAGGGAGGCWGTKHRSAIHTHLLIPRIPEKLLMILHPPILPSLHKEERWHRRFPPQAFRHTFQPVVYDLVMGRASSESLRMSILRSVSLCQEVGEASVEKGANFRVGIAAPWFSRAAV